jgi:catechol 2,3-dioxygenase-like lactoylglutathione lyase family enzyme
MPRIHRVLETALYCERLAQTARFYQALLGGEPLLESERLVALDAGGGTVLLLFQKGQSSTPLKTPGGVIPAHDGSGPTHVAFAIEADDLAAWEKQLAASGVEIESRVSWDRGGRSFYFRDPEGRSVELATPGTWATY